MHTGRFEKLILSRVERRRLLRCRLLVRFSSRPLSSPWAASALSDLSSPYPLFVSRLFYFHIPVFEQHGHLSAQCFVRAPATANTSFAKAFWELQRLDKYAERCLVTQAAAQRRRLMNSVRDSNFFGSVATFPSPLDAGEPAMCTQKELYGLGRWRW